MGIPVLPPDVNESFSDFTVVIGQDRDSIRFGLSSIKNFGEGVGKSIIHERKAKGRFSSLSDFLRRSTDKNLNRKSLESLIQCGALEHFGERGVMLLNLDRMLEYHRQYGDAGRSQDSLFAAQGSGEDMSLQGGPEAALPMKLAWEKELLGLYISGHPLDRYKEKLSKRLMDIKDLKEKLKPGMTGVVAGIVEEVKPILTKGGDQMAFVRVADQGASLEAVIFPRLFNQHKALLQPEKCVAIKGRLSERNGTLSLVAEAVREL